MFNESESRIIKSCIRLYQIQAKDIMTPSVVVESVNADTRLKELSDRKEWRFSRIIVHDKSDEYVSGYVLKDLILENLSKDLFDTKIRNLMRPILTFPENESVHNIWEKMLQKREHISAIVDEYGCLRGVVSMEDIIEAMTGTEIVDEQDIVVDMQELAHEKYEKSVRQTVNRQ